jgi:hypothetical protein
MVLHDMSTPNTTDDDLNWQAVTALYAALLLGIAWLLYWGDYRNATWLALIGTGGACTAYGRVLARRGRAEAAAWWKGGGAVFYVVFVVWAGSVLLDRL